MNIPKLFESLNEEEKNLMFDCILDWKLPHNKINEHRILSNIDDWIDSKSEMSTRLKNILQSLYGNERIFRFVEQVTIKRFLKCRNAGKNSWKEFISFRGY